MLAAPQQAQQAQQFASLAQQAAAFLEESAQKLLEGGEMPSDSTLIRASQELGRLIQPEHHAGTALPSSPSPLPPLPPLALPPPLLLPMQQRVQGMPGTPGAGQQADTSVAQHSVEQHSAAQHSTTQHSTAHIDVASLLEEDLEELMALEQELMGGHGESEREHKALMQGMQSMHSMQGVQGAWWSGGI